MGIYETQRDVIFNAILVLVDSSETYTDVAHYLDVMRYIGNTASPVGSKMTAGGATMQNATAHINNLVNLPDIFTFPSEKQAFTDLKNSHTSLLEIMLAGDVSRWSQCKTLGSSILSINDSLVILAVYTRILDTIRGVKTGFTRERTPQLWDDYLRWAGNAEDGDDWYNKYWIHVYKACVRLSFSDGDVAAIQPYASQASALFKEIAQYAVALDYIKTESWKIPRMAQTTELMVRETNEILSACAGAYAGVQTAGNIQAFNERVCYARNTISLFSLPTGMDDRLPAFMRTTANASLFLYGRFLVDTLKYGGNMYEEAEYVYDFAISGIALCEEVIAFVGELAYELPTPWDTGTFDYVDEKMGHYNKSMTQFFCQFRMIYDAYHGDYYALPGVVDENGVFSLIVDLIASNYTQCWLSFVSSIFTFGVSYNSLYERDTTVVSSAQEFMNDPTSTADWVFLSELMDILQQPDFIQQLRDIIDAPYAPYTPAPKKLLTSTIKPVPVDDPAYRRAYYIGADVARLLNAIQTLFIDNAADPVKAGQDMYDWINADYDDYHLTPGFRTFLEEIPGYPEPIKVPGAALKSLMAQVSAEFRVVLNHFRHGDAGWDDTVTHGALLQSYWRNIYANADYLKCCLYYRLPVPSLDAPIPPYEPLGPNVGPPPVDLVYEFARVAFDVADDFAWYNDFVLRFCNAVLPTTYKTVATTFLAEYDAHVSSTASVPGTIEYLRIGLSTDFTYSRFPTAAQGYVYFIRYTLLPYFKNIRTHLNSASTGSSSYANAQDALSRTYYNITNNHTPLENIRKYYSITGSLSWPTRMLYTDSYAMFNFSADLAYYKTAVTNYLTGLTASNFVSRANSQWPAMETHINNVEVGTLQGIDANTPLLTTALQPSRITAYSIAVNAVYLLEYWVGSVATTSSTGDFATVQDGMRGLYDQIRLLLEDSNYLQKLTTYYELPAMSSSTWPARSGF